MSTVLEVKKIYQIVHMILSELWESVAMVPVVLPESNVKVSQPRLIPCSDQHYNPYVSILIMEYDIPYSLNASNINCLSHTFTCQSIPLGPTVTTDATPPVDSSTLLTTKSSTTTAGAGAETTFTVPVETSTTYADSTAKRKPNPTSGAIVNTEETTDPDSIHLNQSESLLAIVLGVVLGLIALLLFGIIVLLILIVLGRKRRKYTMQFPNGR